MQPSPRFVALLATRAAITASLFGFSQAAELLPSDGIPLDASLNSHQSLGGAQLAPSYEGGLDERNEELMPSYQPEIGPFGRSIIGRASPTAISMSLSLPMSQNIQPNGSTCFVLSSSAITDSSSSSSTNGRRDERQDTHERRADSTKLYLSGTTCLIPGLTDDNEKSQEAPQLQLVVSTSQSDGCPTSTDGVDDDMWIAFDEGMGTLSVDVPEGSPVYIGVVAPKKAGQFSGVYNAEVAASTSGYYHQYDDFASDTGRALLWMDSDSSAALLVSHNLTDDHSADKIKEIMNQTAPYELFVQNNASPSLKGMQRSLCGMEGQALISANSANTGRQNGLVTTSMTTRGAGGLPKQQFYFEGLNQTSSYTAVLVKVNSTSSSSDSQKRQTSDADRSYTVYSPVQFSTLSGTTCKVITDLDFCTDTQYAVPGNGDLKGPELAEIYDNYARDMYAHFETVMMQVACEADSTSKYSLARSCDDCKVAYKNWLCNVAIPRCEDYTSSNSFAYERNVGHKFPNGTALSAGEIESLVRTPGHNASRNKFIDEKIGPGPYKEILPCDDLCYEVVQSCPAVLGFQCPQPGMIAFNSSYGRRFAQAPVVTCNYPGQPRNKVSGAGALVPSTFAALGAISMSVALATL